MSTVFVDEGLRVKMGLGDYHGLDFNTDLHCVEGAILPGKVRVLLKLHFMVVSPGGERWGFEG